MADDSEVMTELRVAMTQLHEAFMEAQAAGFTEAQAMTLVVGMASRG